MSGPRPMAWVIMGNDYPAAVVIGTEEQAEAVVKQYREAGAKRHAQNYSSVAYLVYWRATSVPLEQVA